MSFFEHGVHEQQGHGNYLVYNLSSGTTVCMMCFLGTLSDESSLASRRLYILRYMGAARLHAICSRTSDC